MTEPTSSRLQAGVAALRAGQASSAAEHFAAVLEAEPRHAQAQLGLALAHRLNADWSASDASAAAVLEVEPVNIRALLLRGEAQRQMGAMARALPFFQAALQGAARMASIPPDLQADLARAQALCAEATAVYEAHIDAALADVASTDRFAHGVEVMLGRRDAYLPRPTQFFFPGLDTRYFFDTTSFEWVGAMEAATGAIRDELIALTADQDFRPYVEALDDRPYADPHGMIDNEEWSAFYLIRDGEVVAANAARCPATMAALAAVPTPVIPGRTPTALFSRLAPGARIPPHHGMLNTRLIGHLPLVVPGPAGLRVGPQTHHWQEGHVCLFDDSIEHEAWNDADAARIILLFDVARPDMTEAENAAVAALFAAIDGFDADR